MLQRGLSNRPSCAVALLIIAGSIVLNLARGENVLADLLWGNHVLSVPKWKCYAQQAARQLHKVFEEVVMGAPQEHGNEKFEKKERKMAEAPRPILPVREPGSPPARKNISL